MLSIIDVTEKQFDLNNLSFKLRVSCAIPNVFQRNDYLAGFSYAALNVEIGSSILSPSININRLHDVVMLMRISSALVCLSSVQLVRHTSQVEVTSFA